MKSLQGKTVLIRADSSPIIGAGHIARTLVLADALREAGAAVTYACRNYEGSFIEFIRRKDHNVRTLPAFVAPKADKYSSWLGADTQQDIDQSFAGENYDLVIIDHYGADASWQKSARVRANKIFCIDDEATAGFDCDLILNQNLLPNPEKLYEGKAPVRCKFLLGPQYALLRSEFKDMRQRTPVRENLENMLIIMGGGDPLRVNEKIIKNLALPLKITVIVGENYKNLEALNNFCARKGYTVIQRVENMASEFLKADFCIGAAGNTSWERCCVKLPSALFMLAENQRHVAESLADVGACKFLGSVDEFDFTTINNVLQPFIDTPELLREMSVTAGNLVDGQGSDRVLNELDQIL